MLQLATHVKENLLSNLTYENMLSLVKEAV